MAQLLREALKISSPMALVLREVPRFHGRSLWHSTPEGGHLAAWTVRVLMRINELAAERGSLSDSDHRYNFVICCQISNLNLNKKASFWLSYIFTFCELVNCKNIL